MVAVKGLAEMLQLFRNHFHKAWRAVQFEWVGIFSCHSFKMDDTDGNKRWEIYSKIVSLALQ